MSVKVKTMKTRKAYYKLFPGFIACLVLFVSCANGKAQQIDFRSEHVVRIDCESRSGSGVIYDAREGCVVLVTAAHVVEGTEAATIVWEMSAAEKTSGQTLETETSSATISEIIRVSGLDLDFLKVQGASAEGAILQNVQRSEEMDKETGDGSMESFREEQENTSSELVLWGYNASGEVLEVAGAVSEPWIYVEDFGCHMLIARAETVPGMSGGGVYDSDGNFIGIICGADENGNVAILSANVIASEYDTIFRQ